MTLKAPKYFEAAILLKQNSDLVIDHIEMPNELNIGQVLVKVHVSGICGSQLGEIAGVKGDDPYLPHLLGHEGCATVLEIGPGVQNVSPGDLVVLHWRKGKGIQADTPKYFWRGENLNAGWVTTFNSHAVVSENRCTKIPLDTNHDVAALMGCAITTGFGVIENNAQIKMGESLVVFGSGGIGLNIIQAASLQSAYPIIAVDINENSLNLSKELGANFIINSKKNNAEKEIKNILKDKELDVFIDNTGVTEVIELGYRLISKEGRLILVGVPKKDNDIKIHSLPLHFGKTITGSHGGESIPEKDIPRYLNLISQGIANVDNIVSSRYNLKEVNKAIESMKKGENSGRIIIDL